MSHASTVEVTVTHLLKDEVVNFSFTRQGVKGLLMNFKVSLSTFDNRICILISFNNCVIRSELMVEDDS